jgi:hypothetical protein
LVVELGAVLTSLPLLDQEECDFVRRRVLELRDTWIPRGGPELPFYTLGAASYIDTTIVQGSNEPYVSKLVETNPLIRENFGWLLAKVMRALSIHLQAVVKVADELALPGFHIFEGYAVPMGETSIHFDLQYLNLPGPLPAKGDRSSPISFTLPIHLPQGGAGLNTWPCTYDDVMEHWRSATEIKPLHQMAAERERTFHPYTPGIMALHSGLLMHQIAPIAKVVPEDQRITLQGHGMFVDDAWTIYW